MNYSANETVEHTLAHPCRVAPKREGEVGNPATFERKDSGLGGTNDTADVGHREGRMTNREKLSPGVLESDRR